MGYGARVLPAMLLVVLATALTPADAAAKPVAAKHPRFKLIYQGSGTYSVDLVSPEGLRGQVDADFKWRIAYRPVPVRHGIIEWRRGNATGSGRWSMSSEADNCSRSGDLALKGDGGGLIDFQGRKLEMIVFPEEGDFSSTDPAGAGGPCDTTDFWRQWVVGFSQVGATDAVDPLTSYFKVPRARLRRKQGITMQTSNETPTFPSLDPPSSCGFGEIGQCTQAFDWRARIRVFPIALR